MGNQEYIMKWLEAYRRNVRAVDSRRTARTRNRLKDSDDSEDAEEDEQRDHAVHQTGSSLGLFVRRRLDELDKFPEEVHERDNRKDRKDVARKRRDPYNDTGKVS